MPGRPGGLIRLGRDIRELLAIVEDDLHANGRHFRTLDGIVLDTSDDICGELIFTVFAAIAKFQHQQFVKGRGPARSSVNSGDLLPRVPARL